MKTDRHGFAMLEALIIGMIFMILSSAMYVYAGMEYRYEAGKRKEQEAYYAAVTAVRMMEQKVMEEDMDHESVGYLLTHGNGMNRRDVKLVFEPDGDELTADVEIPVAVWSEVDGDRLLLAAEAHVGQKTSTVRLRMQKQEEHESETEWWKRIAYETDN